MSDNGDTQLQIMETQRQKLEFNLKTRKAKQQVTREVLLYQGWVTTKLNKLSLSLLSFYIPSSAGIKGVWLPRTEIKGVSHHYLDCLCIGLV